MSEENPILINDDSDSSDSESSDGTLNGDRGYWSETYRRPANDFLGTRVTSDNLTLLERVGSLRLLNGQAVRAGDFVELRELPFEHDQSPGADFLLVKKILYHIIGRHHILRGLRLIRNRKLGGSVPLVESEVCMLLEKRLDDRRSPQAQSLVDYPSSAALTKRRIIFTNTSMLGTEERLVCKYSVTRVYKDAHHLRTQKSAEGLYQRISEKEAEAGFATSDEALFLDWRQLRPTDHELGSSGMGSLESRKSYTFGDAFAGCGGVSRGADQAGLKLQWAFDMAVDAFNTLRLNHEYENVWHATADQFYCILASGPENLPEHQVSILHFSPPCQFFSPANTRGGHATNDEANSAAIFSIGPITKKVRPRVCTLEETAGLKTHRPEWFPAVINMFLSLGFSLRWKILNLADYGVSQRRKRLVIIASCPGSELPNFPPITHYRPQCNRLPRYTTIADCITNLDERIHSQHNPSTMLRQNFMPYSSNVQLQRCITTSGSDNYHPSGTRRFTVRELASLMSFPYDFEFPRGQTVTSMRCQIGNAVPPVFSTALLEAIKQALMREDEVRGYVG